MTLEGLKTAIANLNRNKGAFYCIEMETTPKLTKKSRKDGTPTDFTVRKRKRFSCKLGCSYENIVNRHLVKAGKEADFVAQKPNGKHYIEGSDMILTDDATQTKHYLAVDMISNAETTYYINDREATKEEIADLKENYLPIVKDNGKEGVIWITPNIDNIKAVY